MRIARRRLLAALSVVLSGAALAQSSSGLRRIGGLMSYGPDVAEMFRRGAHFVDQLLKGAKPGELAIEQPARFELAVNVRTAAAFGLTLSPALLKRADRILR